MGSPPTPERHAPYIVERPAHQPGLAEGHASTASRPKTHFAQVLVEADYRMKLIGIGLEQPPVRMVSYVDRANPAAGRAQRPAPLVLPARLPVRPRDARTGWRWNWSATA